MADQYVATDTKSGLQVAVTGVFPADPEDRVRIARTCTLFTRLMATILGMPDVTPRREGFKAIETQLEVADALLPHYSDTCEPPQPRQHGLRGTLRDPQPWRHLQEALYPPR